MSKAKLRLKKKYRNFKQLRYILIKYNDEAELYNKTVDLDNIDDYFDIVQIRGKEYYKPKDNIGTIVSPRKIIFGRKERA